MIDAALTAKREANRLAAQRYRERHPDRVAATQEKYRNGHREVTRARAVDWRSRNPDYWRTAHNKRKKAFGSATLREIRAIVEK